MKAGAPYYHDHVSPFAPEFVTMIVANRRPLGVS
jgi:hypothetical protein